MAPNSKGAEIVVSLWVLTFSALVFMILRFICKHRYSQRFGSPDDIILFISWIFVLLYAALTTTAVFYGIGTHVASIPPAQISVALKYVYIGEFFGILAIPISKASFSLTLLRITVRKSHKWMIWFILATTNLTMWACAFLIFFQCRPISGLWTFAPDRVCVNRDFLNFYSIFAAIYSMVADFILAACPWLIIRHLQMNRKEKIGVILAMSLGVFAGITAAIKSSFLPKVMSYPDPTYDIAALLIWAHAESCITIIAASIPFLRVLVRDASTGRATTKPTNQGYQMYGSRSKMGTSRPQRERPDEGDDGTSAKSILGDAGTAMPGEGGKGGIMRQQDIRVEWEGSDGEMVSQRESRDIERSR